MQHTRPLTQFSNIFPIICRRQLLDLACDKWPMVSDEGRQGMARMAAAAAWGLGNWESMEEYSCLILRDSYDGAFYRAVLAVHQDHFGQAQLVCVLIIVGRFFFQIENRQTSFKKVDISLGILPDCQLNQLL